jgi:5-methylcytosine-specific restriction endonuclease McrA
MNALALSANGSLLNRAVLLLNANYTPLAVCSAKRAICLYYLQKVEIVESYPEKVHSPTVTLAIPSVIKLKTYLHYNSMAVILSRKNILVRDRHTCQYCGRRTGSLTVDHIIPKERGGTDTWENLVTACPACNRKKGNRTPEEARMPLLKKPIRPNRIHYFQQYVTELQHPWRPYLFMEPLR